jgi:hypothetical protein
MPDKWQPSDDDRDAAAEMHAGTAPATDDLVKQVREQHVSEDGICDSCTEWMPCSAIQLADEIEKKDRAFTMTNGQLEAATEALIVAREDARALREKLGEEPSDE